MQCITLKTFMLNQCVFTPPSFKCPLLTKKNSSSHSDHLLFSFFQRLRIHHIYFSDLEVQKQMDIQYIISQSKQQRWGEKNRFLLEYVSGRPRSDKDGGRFRRGSGSRTGVRERFSKRKKKSAVIDYFAGKVSQITRPFILKKTMTMQTLTS